MSRSSKVIISVAVLAALSLAASLMLSQQTSKATSPPSHDNFDKPVDLRQKRIAAGVTLSHMQTNDTLTTKARPRTAGVQELSVQTPDVLPPLSGYIVDRFDRWTTIPAGYSFEGLAVHEGKLTLAGDAESTTPRLGTLSSPPIPMMAPALAAPADNTEPLEMGADVQLEISLSENG